jgi:hypothetical protein
MNWIEKKIETGEGLQKLGLCSALRAYEQGGIFIVPHLLWHGASVPKGRPIEGGGGGVLLLEITRNHIVFFYLFTIYVN